MTRRRRRRRYRLRKRLAERLRVAKLRSREAWFRVRVDYYPRLMHTLALFRSESVRNLAKALAVPADLLIDEADTNYSSAYGCARANATGTERMPVDGSTEDDF